MINKVKQREIPETVKGLRDFYCVCGDRRSGVRNNNGCGNRNISPA